MTIPTTDSDPLALLNADRLAARAADDPMASVRSIALIVNNQPTTRTLVLRDVEERLAIFVNATSPKFSALTASQMPEVLVWLPSQQVQYRLRVAVQSIDPKTVRDSWQLRPKPAKRLDWFYSTKQAQSSAVASRTALANDLDAIERDWGADRPAAPDTAVGFLLDPTSIERLYLDEASRLHDRRRFDRQGADDGDGRAQWQVTVLVP